MKKFRDFIAANTRIACIGGAFLGFVGSVGTIASLAVLSSNITAPFIFGAIAGVIVGTGGGAALGIVVGFAIAGISYLAYKHFSNKPVTPEIIENQGPVTEQSNLLSSQAVFSRNISAPINNTNDRNESENREKKSHERKKGFSLFNLFHRKSKEEQSKSSTIVQPPVILAPSNQSRSP